MLALDVKYDKFSSDIISRMSEDQVTNVIKHDQLLMLYGYTLYEKGGVEKFNEISNKIRNVSRLPHKFKRGFTL